MESGLLPTPPTLPASPHGSNPPPFGCMDSLQYFLYFRLGNGPCTPGKHEHPLSILSSRASSPQHATDSPSCQFPEMLHVIPKAEPVFSGSPLGCPAGPRDWATAAPVQARARYSCYSQQWGHSHDETAETRNFKRRSWKNPSRRGNHLPDLFLPIPELEGWKMNYLTSLCKPHFTGMTGQLLSAVIRCSQTYFCLFIR